jgi:Ribbon-helix-helix protein, copG family
MVRSSDVHAEDVRPVSTADGCHSDPSDVPPSDVITCDVAERDVTLVLHARCAVAAPRRHNRVMAAPQTTDEEQYPCRMSIGLTREQKATIARIAKAEDIPQAWLVRRAVIRWLEEYTPSKGIR